VLNDVVLNQVLVRATTDDMTLALVAAVQQDGTCWCGPTTWQHRPAMRISVSGWATTDEDIKKARMPSSPLLSCKPPDRDERHRGTRQCRITGEYERLSSAARATDHTRILGERKLGSLMPLLTQRDWSSTWAKRTMPPLWLAVPVRCVIVLTAPNWSSAHGAVVVLDVAVRAAVTC